MGPEARLAKPGEGCQRPLRKPLHPGLARPEDPDPPDAAKRRKGGHGMSSSAIVRTVLLSLLTALGVLFGLYLLFRLEAIIQLIILAVFLAVALNPAVMSVHRRPLPHPSATLALFLSL